MFAGEVLIVLVILVLARRVHDTPAEEGVQLDLVGTALSAARPRVDRHGHPEVGQLGDRPAQARGAAVARPLAGHLADLRRRRSLLALFVAWERRRIERGEGALFDPQLLRNMQLRSGVSSFLFMQLVLAGTFFVVPLFLSVALGLSAIETGVRLLPLSLTLLVFAVGVPKLRPNANPRRVVNVGFMFLFAGLVLLVGLLEVGAGPEIITWPLLLIGTGLGSMASQLGAATVSSVPDERSGEVGGLQNTGTQLGASIGTALAGAILISALTASFFTGIKDNPAIPASVSEQATTELAAGVPFISDKDLEAALDEAGVPQDVATAAVDENEQARIAGLRAALAVLALIALLGLIATRNLPVVPAGTGAKPVAPPG